MLFLYILEYVFSPISFNGVTPEFALVAIVCMSAFEGQYFGAVYGLIWGLLCDFGDHGLFGTKGILFMIIGYSAAFFIVNYFAGNIPVIFIVSMTSTFFCQLVMLGIYSMSSSADDFYIGFYYVLLPKVIFAIPVTIILFILYKLLHIFTADKEMINKKWA